MVGTGNTALHSQMADMLNLMKTKSEEQSQPSEPALELVAEMVDEEDSVPAEEPEVNEELRPAFLQRAANSGGADTLSGGAESLEVVEEANSQFLRPAGRRNIGEVEVPETQKGPVPISRSTASGLGPEKPGEDRSTPAYIRKYMD